MCEKMWSTICGGARLDANNGDFTYWKVIMHYESKKTTDLDLFCQQLAKLHKPLN